MKIAIDISQIVYGTGVSRYTKLLVESLLKADHKNQYILFGTSLRKNKDLKSFCKDLSNYKNVEFKIFRFPLILFEFLWNRLHLLPIDKLTGEIDIFHSSDWVQPPMSSASTKKITTIHDMLVFLFPTSLPPRIVKNQKRRLVHVKKDVDRIITNSQTTKEDVIKFLQIPEEKVVVTYLAASPNFKPQDDEVINQVLEKYKIKKPYILSVATQEPRKNIQKLLDAFDKLIQASSGKNQSVHLVLTGKYGWGEGFRLSQSGQKENKVTWTGYVPEEDLIALYAGCRVFVYPSLYEGFGLPVLEAMSCGAPTITSNNSSMVEIAKDTAILIDPRSETQLVRALDLVLNLNLENYQKMVNASLNRARAYTWQKTAKQTLNIYEEVFQDNQKEDNHRN